MSILSPYNQLQIVKPEPLAGSGGQALNDNFKTLSTKMTTSDPGSGNDNTEGYGQGSIWYNSSTNTAFICVDATTSAAQWNPLPKEISFTNIATSGTITGLAIVPIYNQTSGTAANTDLLINRTETAVGSGNQRLIDAQVGGTSKFYVDDTGNLFVNGNLEVDGSTSLDDGNITTDGSGNMTLVSLSNTSGDGLNIYGGVNITNQTDVYNLNSDGVTTLDSNTITTDGSGNLTAVSFIGSGASLTGLSATNISTGTLSPAYGGTGVNNGTKTITLGGNLTTSGAFTTTLTATANTSVTLPTSGTLLSTTTPLTLSAASGVTTAPLTLNCATTGLSSLTNYNGLQVNDCYGNSLLNVFTHDEGSAGASVERIVFGNSSVSENDFSFGFGSYIQEQSSSLVINSVGTFSLNAASYPIALGGTVSISGHTLSLAGALTTSGAFASTFTMTGATSVTFPTSGTLTSTSGFTMAGNIAMGGNNISGAGTITTTNLTVSGTLTATLISLTGTAAALSTVVIAAGEYAFTTDTHVPLVGDGSTAGGLAILKQPVSSGGFKLNAAYYGSAPGVGGVDLQIHNLSGGSSTSGATGVSSFVAGSNNLASGVGSTAFGHRCTASGNYSTASGCYCTASNISAISFGYATTASGYYSTASGYWATASGRYSVAIGTLGATASGSGSVAIGRCTSSGNYSVALGNGSATADYSFAVGNGSATKRGQNATGSAYLFFSQRTVTNLQVATTTNAQSELTTDGSAPTGTTEPSSNRFIIPASKSFAIILTVTGKQSGSNNVYMAVRQLTITNISGTMTISTVYTIGTDINPGSWTTPLTVQADSTNKSLQVLVIGPASTNIHWRATVTADELVY